MEINKIIVNMVLAGLVVFGLLSFGLTLQRENGGVNLTDDSLLNDTYTSLAANLEDIQGSSKDMRATFEKEDPIKSSGSLVFSSIIFIGKSLTTLGVFILNVFILLPASVIGIDPLVYGIISGLVLISMLLALYFLYKIGQ